MSAVEILEQIRRLPEGELQLVLERIEVEFAPAGRVAPEEARAMDQRFREHLENPGDVVSWDNAKARLDSLSQK